MGLKRAATAFGMSAAIATGGAFSLDRAFEKGGKHDLQKACATKPYAESPECEDLLTTPDAIYHTRVERNVYGWIGGIAIVISLFGAGGAYQRLDEPDTTPAPASQSNAA